ncbi:MAG TPA: ABC-F family ATP-binding cassette domain-containing protein [Campylobacterales bacterium]|nr:ABC-F family ATP-binding cassette domain-containing protein [Campylobacterales bacterium]HIO70582.1 ABC-F family ATP-binding cassette domain-containing protein [Campylobacterales bacterium]
MLQTINLTKRFGKRVLFENINLKLDRNKRYGLIGANGAGKTTFLKILSGEIEDYEGEVVIESGLRVGVLGQNQFAFEDFTVLDAVLYGNRRLYDAIKEKEKLYMSGEFTDEVNNRLAELEVITVEEDPTYEYEVNITKILEGLGIPASKLYEPMSSLTSADKFKVLLAQVLFPKPDILFLDEPTNNLDLDAISWLENQLKRHEGTMVVISHDRHFLNEVVTHILDLDYQTIREFTGNYNDWYIASTLMAKQKELERNRKLKEKEELESFIRRFSANASKAKQATSRQKQLEKLNIEELKPSSRRDPSIVFKMKRPIGNDILVFENVTFGYEPDRKIFKNLTLKFNHGDKIALIGANGVGKSTLCNLIMGKLKPETGEIKWGVTVQPSYFPQNTTDLIDGDETLYNWLKSFNPKGDLSEVRNCLGRMLFSGEEQEKSVKSVSGGEKHRLMLSKMMLEQGNFLILDEPNNHLDLESIIALGEALRQFPSNVIVVSHDRELLDSFANRVIEIKPDGTIVDFRGTYEEYREREGK